MGKLDTAFKVVELGKNAQGLAQAANTFRADNRSKSDLGRNVGRRAFNEAAGVGKTMGKTSYNSFEMIPRLICRAIQLILALVVCGVYGSRVDADSKAGDGLSPEWLFAVIIGTLSALTAGIFLLSSPLGAIPYIGAKLKLSKTYRAFPLDLSLFLAWVVAFGIFAGIFLKRDSDDPYKGSSVTLMKGAMWVDLVNAILWLISGVYGAVKTCTGRQIDRVSGKAADKIFRKRTDTGEDTDVELGSYSARA